MPLSSNQTSKVVAFLLGSVSYALPEAFMQIVFSLPKPRVLPSAHSTVRVVISCSSELTH